MPLTPAQRSLRARIAALTRWSTEDPKPNGERAQRGLRARIERETRERFPDLGDTELARRADCAYRAHFARLGFASGKARGARAGKTPSTKDGAEA